MTPTDWRALCAELLDEVAARPLLLDRELIDRARAALAEPEPEAVEPTDEEVEAWAGDQGFIRGHGDHPCGFWIDDGDAGAFARAVLARFGHQPAPPAEGEVAELVADELVRRLRTKAATEKSNRCHYSAILLTRAATLLEQRHPAPVPVSERLPGPGDCDGEGRCWWGFEETDDYEASWTLRKMIGLPFDDTHWLPATALPLPAGEVEA